MFANETSARLMVFALKSVLYVLANQVVEQKWRGDFLRWLKSVLYVLVN
jgi:hypothetical protein